jgi:hypothetical protein
MTPWDISSCSHTISGKHRIPSSHFDTINQVALQNVLRGKKIQQRAFTIKLIPGWIPMNGNLCWQGRARHPLCLLTVETYKHVSICLEAWAIERRVDLLLQFVRQLLQIGAPLFVTTLIDYKLMISLHLP